MTMTKNGSARFTTMLSIGVAAVGLASAGITGAYQLISMTTEVRVLTQEKDSLAGMVNRQRADIATLALEVNRQKSALIEIETQFCATDNMRNIIHANDLRIQAMVWRKVFGDELPTANAFYPRVCNRREP
jgi:hypothetical protein